MKPKAIRKLRFVDLFAGLGGFHQALAALGHDCVFACEIDPELAEIYEKNFGLKPAKDIRDVHPSDVPKHDVLCAGFPCQNYSKAGDQLGLDCPRWGDLVDYIVAILRHHQPRMLIMENVPNLMRHEQGKTWEGIRRKLARAGYKVSEKKLSPDMFGVPQVRERAFIVGHREGLEGYTWPGHPPSAELSVRNILDDNPPGARILEPHFIEYLDAWQQLLQALPSSEPLPSWPIWAMEFGATYPYTTSTPHAHGYKNLGRYRGSLGRRLDGLAPSDVKEALPSYALESKKTFPDWKIEFIRKNRAFYQQHRDIIDAWLPRIITFAPSFQKLEWNCKGGERDIWSYLIQFRASGIRVKSTHRAPSLIAMTTSQVPVVAWQRRFMTERECSRLQSMGSLQHLPKSKSAAFRALGNAVNVEVVRAIARELFRIDAYLRQSVSSSKARRNGHKPELADAA
jgi:DNA (cytosine-5)-methyltransferase 1